MKKEGIHPLLLQSVPSKAARIYCRSSELTKFRFDIIQLNMSYRFMEDEIIRKRDFRFCSPEKKSSSITLKLKLSNQDNKDVSLRFKLSTVSRLLVLLTITQCDFSGTQEQQTQNKYEYLITTKLAYRHELLVNKQIGKTNISISII